MDTKELLAKVRKIELRTRRIVDELTGGAYHSVFKGQGMEFEEVREYQVGDDVRTIDWNVTARMGHPYLKKFVEERELTVFLLVDISASGDTGRQQPKLDQVAELAGLLAFSAIRNQDRVGLLLFSDRDELLIPPRKGRRHVLRLVRDMLVHERRHRGTAIGQALATLLQVCRRRAVVFVISDFLDQGYERQLAMAARYHDVSGVRVLDRSELAVPATGFVALEDAESGEALTLHAGRRFANAYATTAAAQAQRTTDLFRRHGVDLIDIYNGEDYIPPLMRFFRQRESRRRR